MAQLNSEVGLYITRESTQQDYININLPQISTQIRKPSELY